MSPGPDPLALLDALYRVEVDDDAWFAGMLEAARPMLDEGFGALVWAFRLGPSGMTMFKTLDEAPFPFSDLSKEWFRHEPGAALRAHRISTPVASICTLLGRRYFAEHPIVRGVLHPTGVHDVMGVVAIEPDGWGLGLGAPLRRVYRASGSRRLFWERVAGHMQAAHRIRRRLGTSRWETLPVAESVRSTGGLAVQWSAEYGRKLSEVSRESQAYAEAVMDPSGRLLDAEGEAQDGAARERLRRAAVAVDRARAGLLRSGVDDDALGQWQALVDGRWSLLDRFENDGRRFLVARRNAPGTMPIPLLDERERAVLGYRAAGHTLKLIAYEMGYSLGYTSRLAQNAMRKLGLTSPADLVAFVQSSATASGDVAVLGRGERPDR